VVLHFPGIGHAVLPTSVCAQAIMTAFSLPGGPGSQSWARTRSTRPTSPA
jgi:hypothetical protein